MIFYTDGSASPNPGPGGFGVVQVDTEGNILVDRIIRLIMNKK